MAEPTIFDYAREVTRAEQNLLQLMERDPGVKEEVEAETMDGEGESPPPDSSEG